VKLYYNDKEFRNTWDTLQTRLRCCGVETYQDFFVSTTSDCFPVSCSIAKMDRQNQTCVKKYKDAPTPSRQSDYRTNVENLVATKEITTTPSDLSTFVRNTTSGVTIIDRQLSNSMPPTTNINSISNSGKRQKTVTSLWKEINLLGCITVLQQLYDKSLINGHGFLAIEIGLCFFILIEVAALALAFAYAMNRNKNADYDSADQLDTID